MGPWSDLLLSRLKVVMRLVSTAGHHHIVNKFQHCGTTPRTQGKRQAMLSHHGLQDRSCRTHPHPHPAQHITETAARATKHAFQACLVINMCFEEACRMHRRVARGYPLTPKTLANPS